MSSSLSNIDTLYWRKEFITIPYYTIYPIIPLQLSLDGIEVWTCTIIRIVARGARSSQSMLGLNKKIKSAMVPVEQDDEMGNPER